MHLAFRYITAAVAAAALFAADPAAAQGAPGQQPTRRIPGTRPSPTTPATPPSSTTPTATPPAADTGAVTSGQPLSEEVKRGLVELNERNQGQIAAGRMAMEKATTPRVKELAEKMVRDRTIISSEMDQYAKDRGLTLQAPRSASTTASQSALAPLQALSGPEFERQYVQLMIRDHQEDVQRLKDLRDRTQGKDSSLKGWLDHMENVMEENLTAFRQVKQSADQERAARRPPAR